MKTRLIFALVSLLGIFPAATFADDASAPDPDQKRPFLAIPKAQQAPTIDGHIDPDEWAGAAMISGFMGATGQWGGKIAPQESRIYVMHDGKRLYVAVYCELRPGVKPSMNYRKRNEPVYMDQYQMELWLTPPVVDQVTAYQMIGNAYGAIYDNRQIPALGIANVQWNGNWEFKNTYVTGEYWMSELAIEFSELHHEAIDPDVFWRGMLGVAWPQRSWPYTFGWYKNLDTHAYFSFIENGNGVQVNDLTALFDNKLAPELTLLNGEESEQTYTLDFKTRGQSWQETVVVPASTRKAVRYDFELPDFPDKGKAEAVRITVRGGNGQLLLDGDWYYTPVERAEIVRKPVDPEPWKMSTRVQFAPTALGVKAWADVLDFPERDALSQVRFLVQREDGELVREASVSRFHYDSAETYIWLDDDLPYGTYEVKVRFEDEEGGLLASDSKGFKHENLKERFVWMGNDKGTQTTIYPPFEAVRVSDGKVLSVWGRDVRMGGAFPEQISSQGSDLLAAPVQLTAVLATGEVNAKMTEPFNIVAQSDTEVLFSGAYEVAGMAITLKGKMAFDGMIFYNLEAEPIAGEAGQAVERLYLSIPVVGEHALYYYTTGGGWSPGVGFTETATAEKTLVWDSSEFGDFVPYVGLTDDAIALQWFADGDHNWILGDDFPSSQIVRAGDVVEMQINLVRRSGALEAFAADFGLIATPTKAMPSNWRNTVLDNRKVEGSTINFFFGPGHGNTPIDLHDTKKLASVLGVDVGDRNPDVVLSDLEPQASRIKADFSREDIHKNFSSGEHRGAMEGLLNWFRRIDQEPHATRRAYFYNAMMYFEGNRSEAFRTFFPGEWALDPPSGWFHLTATETYRDFFAFYVDLWFKHWIVPGLYFDEVYLFPDYNVFNGNGKVMEDGSVRPSFALMAQRDYMFRMRQLFIDHEQEPFIWVHTSNFMAPYAISAVDIAMFGEDRSPNPTTDIIDAIPPMLFRTIGRSQKFGFVPVWMTMAGRGGSPWALAGRQTFGWCWQHDVVPEVHTVRRDRHLLTLRSGWGIGEDDVSFIPYWDTRGAMATHDEKLIASAWVRPGGRVMVQVMNLDYDVEKGAVVELDAKKLGLTGNFHVLDLESDPVSKEWLAFTAEIDAKMAVDRNAPLGEGIWKWNNVQDMVSYDPEAMEVLSTGTTVKLKVAPRNFRTFIIEPLQ